MRDAKSLLLLLVSLLLVLVSFGLLWTWGYRFYNKNDEITKAPVKIVMVDSNAIANRVRDSLQTVYAETLQSLDSQYKSTLSNSDSLKTQLDIKLDEFYRLSNEIAALLKNRNANTNYTTAKQKINELQNKVEDLKDKNQVVEKENNKLTAVLDNIRKPEKPQDTNTKKPEFNTKQVSGNNNVSEKSTPTFAVFVANDLRLSGLMVNRDDKEVETSVADQTEKFGGSFNVLNNISQLSNAEVVVVILQPDGRPLKTSGWESGSFNTPDGKKVYSYKFNFKYIKGENKRLYFSLRSAEKYQKGDYTMQVYYNGMMIGRTTKRLS